MIIQNKEIPIYGGRLHVIFSKDIEKDFDLIKKKYPKTLNKKRLGFCAQSTTIQNHYAVFFNIKNMGKKDFESEIVNTIAHETVHICSFMAKRIGLYLDVDNDESIAYLSGWIAGEMYKCYLKFKEDEQSKAKQIDKTS